MTIGTLKSPNPRYWTSISLMKSKFLSVSMNTLLAILKVTDARRDVILAGGLYHRFSWRNNPPPPPGQHRISLSADSQHEDDGKRLNLSFMGHVYTRQRDFLPLIFGTDFSNLNPGKFTPIWRIDRNGIRPIKFETA